MKIKKCVAAAIIIGLLLAGCSTIEETFPRKKAEKLVVNEHNNEFGTTKIKSVVVKYNAYYIKWENKGDKASGTDKVTKDGKIKMVDARIE